MKKIIILTCLGFLFTLTGCYLYPQEGNVQEVCEKFINALRKQDTTTLNGVIDYTFTFSSLDLTNPEEYKWLPEIDLNTKEEFIDYWKENRVPDTITSSITEVCIEDHQRMGETWGKGVFSVIDSTDSVDTVDFRLSLVNRGGIIQLIKPEWKIWAWSIWPKWR